MKIKQKMHQLNKIIPALFLGVFIVLGLTVFGNQQDANAATVLDHAVKYCKKYNGDNGIAKKRETACTFGYVQGNSYCKSLKAEFNVAKAACNDGAKKGKADPLNNPTNDADDNDDETTEPTDTPGSGPECDTAVLPKSLCSGSNGEGIWGILTLVIAIMTAGVGVLAVGGIVYAAILYATAADKAAQVTKAKETIFNVVIGLLLFAAMWALLQFLIPGGVL